MKKVVRKSKERVDESTSKRTSIFQYMPVIVKILFAVAFVSLKFVGIYQVVKEGDDSILEVGDFFLRWFNVEGELFESLDAHELVVESEHGIEQWSLLEISYGLLPIKHFFNIN